MGSYVVLPAMVPFELLARLATLAKLSELGRGLQGIAEEEGI
jgi:hypothetical protein